VYWRRRLTLLMVAAVLVLGLVALVHGGGSHGDRAAQVADVTTPSAAPGPTGRAATERSASGAGAPATSRTPTTAAPAVTAATPTALATPSGPCQDADVVVTPGVTVLPTSVSIRLALTSATTPACTWEISPGTVQVAIKRAGADVWNTALCREAVPTESLVVRQGTPAYVDVVWGGHIATDGCSVHNPAASYGTYKVQAAALGGKASSALFRLSPPAPPPAPSRTPHARTSETASAAATVTSSPTASPTATGGAHATKKPTKKATSKAAKKKRTAHPTSRSTASPGAKGTAGARG
jgi:hypothetical protein